jgi:ubiquinone biosynthesis protein COQ4
MYPAAMAMTVPSILVPRLQPSELLTLARCVVRVLADSNRTLDIVVAEELLGKDQLPHLLVRGTFDSPEGRDVLADKPDVTQTDMDYLRGLDEGTLGRTFADFQDHHGLDIRLLRQPTPYTKDPEVAYVLHRLRASHDLWHTLIGLGTQGHEEVLVHAFSLAQTGMPASVAIIALGALKHMVLEGRWDVVRRDIRRAYGIGRQASAMLGVYWERHWEDPILEVRQRYGLETVYA